MACAIPQGGHNERGKPSSFVAGFGQSKIRTVGLSLSVKEGGSESLRRKKNTPVPDEIVVERSGREKNAAIILHILARNSIRLQHSRQRNCAARRRASTALSCVALRTTSDVNAT